MHFCIGIQLHSHDKNTVYTQVEMEYYLVLASSSFLAYISFCDDSMKQAVGEKSNHYLPIQTNTIKCPSMISKLIRIIRVGYATILKHKLQFIDFSSVCLSQ